jgi:hypothetical protein
MEAAVNAVPASIRLRWHLLRAVEEAGLPGAAAAAIALAAVVAGLAVALPLDGRAHALEAGNAALERRIAAARRAPTPAPVLSTSAQLAAFERGLVDERALALTYARLFAIAQSHGLALRQAEFKLGEATAEGSGDGGGAVARYAIVLPVTADYRALRAFVAQALRELPALALEGVSLRRDDAKATQLEAKLRLVLFVARGA